MSARPTELSRRGPALVAAVVLASALASLAPRTALCRRPSRAELVRAETYASLAKEKFRAGQYEEAAELFMRVYRLSKKQTAVFNAARCKEMGERLAEAKGLFELYLSIADSDDGKEDARDHLVRIAEQMAVQRRAEREAARREATARRQAEDQARRAEQARRAAEERARKLEQERRKPRRMRLVGACVLPAAGALGGEAALAAAGVLQLAEAEARRARIGGVRSVAVYNRVESRRGVVGNCDLSCRLSVARGLGARWAIGTTVGSREGLLRARSVLWRTLDMGQDGTIEVRAADRAGLLAAYEAAIGDLFNRVRVLPLAVGPATAVTPATPGVAARAPVEILTRPPGAALWLDERRVGVTPGRQALAPGWHRVRVVLAGYHPRGGLIYLRDGRGGTLRISLPGLLPPPAPPPQSRPPAAPRPPATTGQIAAPNRLPATGSSPASRAPVRPSTAVPLPAAPRPAVPGPPTGPAASSRPSGHPPAAHSPAATPAPLETGPGRDAGSGARPEFPRAPKRRATEPSEASVPSSPPEQPPPEPLPSDREGVGWLWSIAGHLTGGLGVFDPRSDAESGGVDTLLGGGLSAHFGYASSSAPHVAWFYLAAGLKYGRYQGHLEGASMTPPSDVTLWAGLGLPRLWGVRLSYAMHLLSHPLDQGRHDAITTVGLGRALTFGYLMLFVGLEVRIDSQRNIGTDVYGEGPPTLLLLELGFNAGGVHLSR